MLLEPISRFRWFRAVINAVVAAVLFSSAFMQAQSTASWLRQYKGIHPSVITRDPRFSSDIRTYLATSHDGGNLAVIASSFLTNGADDSVQILGPQVTMTGCANHGGECAFLWATSAKSTADSPLLALCLMEPDLWLYVSSQSISLVPPALLNSVQSWRRKLGDDGYVLHPDHAFLVTKDGSIHPLDLKTLTPSHSQ